MREEEAGWVVPPEKADAIAGTIRSAAAANVATQEMGHRATVVVSRYTRPTAFNAYRSLMNDLLNATVLRSTRNMAFHGTAKRSRHDADG